MNFIDTHCHLYLPEFAPEYADAVERAVQAGVNTILLPGIDHTSYEPMLQLRSEFPDRFHAMAGLHPTSVSEENIQNELSTVLHQLENGRYIAVGEIGIDLYWDKTRQDLQEEAFRTQLQWAKKFRLPVAIHVRNSYNEVWRILKNELTLDLKGVFHCFPGNVIQAKQVIEAGFLLGIGGVVTFKNSGMQEVVSAVGTANIILETDAPFLAPAPFRGKRNEPAYIPVIATKVAELCNINVEEVAEITTANAIRLFNLQD